MVKCLLCATHSVLSVYKHWHIESSQQSPLLTKELRLVQRQAAQKWRAGVHVQIWASKCVVTESAGGAVPSPSLPCDSHTIKVLRRIVIKSPAELFLIQDFQTLAMEILQHPPSPKIYLTSFRTSILGITDGEKNLCEELEF